MSDAREGHLDSHPHLTQGANGGVRLKIPRNGVLRHWPAQRSHFHYGNPVPLYLVKFNLIMRLLINLASRAAMIALSRAV